MKKRFKFLSILSSIFGVGAICGFFALSTFNNKQIEETKADTSVVISANHGFYEVTSSYEYTITGNNISRVIHYDGSGYFDYDYIYSYQIVDGVTKYQFTCSFSMYFDVVEIRTINNGNPSIYGTYRFYLNYLDDARRLLNPSVNNLPRFTIYSSFYDVEPSNIQLYFNGLNSTSGFYGLSYFKFYLDSLEQELQTVLTDSQGNYVLSGNDIPTQYLVRCFSNTQFMVGGELYAPFSQIVIDSQLSYNQTDFDSGYSAGYIDGYNQGNTSGYNQGYTQGIEAGKEEQLQIDTPLFSQYYTDGYSAGYSDADNEDAVTTSVINGILQVGFVPVNFFLSILNLCPVLQNLK